MQTLQQKQEKALQLTKDLEKSLSLQKVDLSVFDKGGFTLRAISIHSQVMPHKPYVKLSNGVKIIMVEKVYSNGEKELFNLENYANLKDGVYYAN